MNSPAASLEACEMAFARRLGFESLDELIEASEPLFSTGGELWFVAELSEGQWLAWPFPELNDTHRFASQEAACEFVQSSATV